MRQEHDREVHHDTPGGCRPLPTNSDPAAGYPTYAATYQIRTTNIPR